MMKSWSDIASYYGRLVDAGLPLSHMFEVVSRIRDSRYARGVVAWTSMHDLCIAQTAQEPFDGPYLRVSPRPDGTLEFRYVDTYIEDRQWHRTVPGADGFSRFERFVDQLRWFGPARETGVA